MLVLALIVPVMTMARENDDSPQDEDDQEEINDDHGGDDDDDNDDSETIAELRAKIAELTALIARLRGDAPDPTRTCTLDVDFPRDLFFGDQDFGSSKSIEALQKALEKRGILRMPEGAAYGFFGNLTRIALERFQIQNGISEKYKDGYAYAGPQTRRALSGCSGPIVIQFLTQSVL